MLPLLQRMSSKFGMSVFTLAELVRTAPYRYKVFTIPKRNGEPRTIAQPARIIKEFQRWLVSEELADLPIHKAATAYRPGSKILDNTAAHSKGAFLLKMDFSDFFPSIGGADLKKHLKKYGKDRWDDQEIGVISNIVLWLPKRSRSLQLCIGGPSSPLISNSIMYDFDRIVSEVCDPLDVTYTRYADDLAFSARNAGVLAGIEKEIGVVLGEVAYPRLRINHAKTVRASKGSLRKVTGLIITPEGSVSIGRERKREIHAKLHHFSLEKVGLEEALTLKGLLAFCLDVEPSFVSRLERKYGAAIIRKILALERVNRRVDPHAK